MQQRRANKESGRFINELNRKLYQNIIVLQFVEYRGEKITKETRLNSSFKLKTVFESQYNSTKKLRVSEVIVDKAW